MGLFNYYPSNPRKLDFEMEKKIFFHSLVFPAAFVFIFWMVKIIEVTTTYSFVRLGIYPLHLKGLPGILFSPLIHSGMNHLISNSIPFFILLSALIYFYRGISYQIFILLYALSGVSVWLAGREAWHIGASGVIYAMAAFHFLSGIIRNDVRLLTLSVVVVFLYGGLIWGIFPIDPKVSWEGHLWGAVCGLVLAFYYRKYIIRRDKFEWEEEDEEEEEKPDFPPGHDGQIKPVTDIDNSRDKTDKGDQESKGTGYHTGFPERFKPENMNHTGNS